MAFHEVVERLKRFTDVVQFERMASDILSRNGHRGIEPQGIGAVDRGKDALLVRAKNKRVYHYSLRKDYENKLREDLESVHKNKHLKRGQAFVFVTNQHVPALTADRLKKFVKDKHGWELDLWARERLRVELENEATDVAEKYLGIRSAAEGDREHLKEIQDQVLRSFLGELRILDACIHLGHPLIMPTFKSQEIPNRLMSGAPQYVVEEIVQIEELSVHESALFTDAEKNHFSREMKAAFAIERSFHQIAKRAADLAEAIGNRFRPRINLPTSPNSLGGDYFNPLFTGAAIVSKLLGVYGGTPYNFVDNGERIELLSSGTRLMQGPENLRRWFMSLADGFVLDPALGKAAAAIGRRLNNLRPGSKRAVRDLESALLAKRLPGSCNLV